MTYPIDGLGRAVVAAGVLGALALGVPMANASPWRLAQTTTATRAASPASPAAPGGNPTTHGPRGPGGLVEARIADLHARLGITAAEEPRFTALAEVMRVNAKDMDTVLDNRADDTSKTAVSTLRWYLRLTDAHAAMLSRFLPPFETLYAALSDDQRKTADSIFQHFGEGPAPATSQ